MRLYTYLPTSHSSLSPIQAWGWLAVLCLGHLFLWTVISSVTRGSVTHDTLEGIAWGMQWQLGYDKHPPLAAWLAAWATQIGGTVGWPVYLLSQIAVVVTFIAVFLLSRLIFPLDLALVATFLSEGILYHNINAINFTPDTVQTPLWAITTLFFYLALTRQRAWAWGGVGVSAGLCVLAKYSAVFLFAPMFCLLLLTANGRKSFYRPSFYGALVVALGIIAPHLLWALANGFTGVHYIGSSLAQGVPETHPWWHHFFQPSKFFISQLGVMLGAVALAWPLWRSKRQSYFTDRFSEIFILMMGLMPFALTIFYAFLTGHRIIPRWATPYFFLIGPILLMLLKPTLTVRKLKQICWTTLIAMLLVVFLRGGYFIYGPVLLGKAHSDAYLPNQQIATVVTHLWHQHFHSPLRYVAGDHYLSAFISAYSSDKPQPFMSWSTVESPWIDEHKMQKQGAVFAWQVDDPHAKLLPLFVRERYPEAFLVDVFTFEKQVPYAKKITPPLYIAVAMLAPSEKN